MLLVRRDFDKMVSVNFLKLNAFFLSWLQPTQILWCLKDSSTRISKYDFFLKTEKLGFCQKDKNWERDGYLCQFVLYTYYGSHKQRKNWQLFCWTNSKWNGLKHFGDLQSQVEVAIFRNLIQTKKAAMERRWVLTEKQWAENLSPDVPIFTFIPLKTISC